MRMTSRGSLPSLKSPRERCAQGRAAPASSNSHEPSACDLAPQCCVPTLTQVEPKFLRVPLGWTGAKQGAKGIAKAYARHFNAQCLGEHLKGVPIKALKAHCWSVGGEKIKVATLMDDCASGITGTIFAALGGKNDTVDFDSLPPNQAGQVVDPTDNLDFVKAATDYETVDHFIMDANNDVTSAVWASTYGFEGILVGEPPWKTTAGGVWNTLSSSFSRQGKMYCEHAKR